MPLIIEFDNIMAIVVITSLAAVLPFPMSTQVSFYGSGFPDAVVFKAHLHADTCENQGGAHFSGGDGVTVDAVNENWPEVTCMDVRIITYVSI